MCKGLEKGGFVGEFSFSSSLSPTGGATDETAALFPFSEDFEPVCSGHI